jgi:hypothetical protein
MRKYADIIEETAQTSEKYYEQTGQYEDTVTYGGITYSCSVRVFDKKASTKVDRTYRVECAAKIKNIVRQLNESGWRY